MNPGKAIFRYKEGSSDLLNNMKSLNIFMVFIQFLFGLFMTPVYIEYEFAVLFSVISTVPSLIIVFLPGLLEDDDIRTTLEGVYSLYILIGLFLFVIGLYYAFLGGKPEELVWWFHVWLMPVLLSISYSFISFEIFPQKQKKMIPVATLPQEPLMNVNCA